MWARRVADQRHVQEVQGGHLDLNQGSAKGIGHGSALGKRRDGAERQETISLQVRGGIEIAIQKDFIRDSSSSTCLLKKVYKTD